VYARQAPRLHLGLHHNEIRQGLRPRVGRRSRGSSPAILLPGGLLSARAAVAVVPLHHGLDSATATTIGGGWGGRVCARDPRVAFAPYRTVCGVPTHERNDCGCFAGRRCGRENGKIDLEVALPLLSRHQCRQSDEVQ
jgi:hypothetical protein